MQIVLYARGLLVSAFVLTMAACGGGIEASPEALCRAARYGETEQARALLERGADYRKAAAGYGVTPLHWAAMDDSPEIIEAVLQRAGQDGRVREIINLRDAWDCTPLMWAAAEGHIQSVEVLVKYGALLDLRGPGGDTALHLSVLSAKKTAHRVVKRLLEAGADAGLTNTAGKTVAEWASLRGRSDMAALIPTRTGGRP